MAVWSTILSSGLGHALRSDAEYYRPHYLALDSRLEAAGAFSISRHIGFLTDGTHITPRYVSVGIPFFSSSDIDAFTISLAAGKFISAEEHQRLKHCQPEGGDILIAKSGRIGTCAVVPSTVTRGDWNIYEGIALLRSKSIDASYLAAFLNSRYGLLQIRRELKGVAQPHLHLEDIRRLKVYVPTDGEQAAISERVETGVALHHSARSKYAQATRVLDAELGLNELTFARPVGYTARFSEIETSRRTDAQHYQPRFTQLLAHLDAFPTARLRDIKTYNRRGLQPIYLPDGDIRVVNSKHLGPQHIDYDNLERTSSRHYSLATVAHIQPEDILVYSTGAYVGRTNVYLDDVPAMASNHVNILRVNPGIDRAYLALVLQSTVGQFQTLKHVRGSTQVELYPDDIDRFVVPLINSAKQKEIGDLLRSSLAKQRESRSRLEQAKARVEAIIEEAVER
jgi:type I restriction enzyme, S subunit